MRIALKVLALGAAIAVSATMAKADQITGELSFASNNTAPLGSATFVDNSGVLDVTFTGGVGTTGGGSPIINSYNGDPATLGNFDVNMSTNALSGYTNPEFTVTGGGSTLDFNATSAVYSALGGGFFDLELIGYLTDTAPGYTATPAVMQFSAQEVGATGVSYSGTIVAYPTPEPSSLALLGTTLLGAAGFARRRFLRS